MESAQAGSMDAPLYPRITPEFDEKENRAKRYAAVLNSRKSMDTPIPQPTLKQKIGSRISAPFNQLGKLLLGAARFIASIARTLSRILTSPFRANSRPRHYARQAGHAIHRTLSALNPEAVLRVFLLIARLGVELLVSQHSRGRPMLHIHTRNYRNATDTPSSRPASLLFRYARRQRLGTTAAARPPLCLAQEPTKNNPKRNH